MEGYRDTFVSRIVVQVAGYVGVTAALFGVLALIALSAPDELVVFLVALGVTVALGGGGMLIGTTPVDAFQRMRSVLWFGAVLAFGATLQALIFGVLGVSDEGDTAELVSVLTGAATSVVAWGLWRSLRRALQLVALHLTLVGTLFGIVLASGDPFSAVEPGIFALVLWLFGVGWSAVATRGSLAPIGTALVLGELTALLAPYVASFPGGGTEGVPLGLCGLWSFFTAVPFLVAGARRDSIGVQGVAIAGVLAGAGALVGELVGGETAAVIAVAIGAVLLGTSLLAIRQGPATAAAPPMTPPPPAPPLA